MSQTPLPPPPPSWGSFPPPPGFEPPQWEEFVPFDEQPRPKPPWTIGQVVAWLVILLGVAVMVRVQYQRPKSPPPKTGDGLAEPQINFRVASRNSVGLKELVERTGQGALAKSQMLSSRPALEQTATSIEDRLRIIPVIVECFDHDAGIKLLNEFSEAHGDRLTDDVAALRIIYSQGPDALTPPQRATLIEHHGWFGELALSYDKPASDPTRQAMLKPALRTILAGIGVLLLGGLFLIMGIIFGIVAIVKIANGTLRFAYRPQYTARPVYLESFAIYLGGFTLILLTASHLNTAMRLVILGFAVILAAIWPLLRGVPLSQAMLALGLHRGKGFFTELLCGVAAYITAVPIIAVGLFITLLLSSLVKQTTTHPIVFDISTDPIRIITIYLLASVWAPITEETLFRGAFFGHLRRRWNWIISALIVSFIFAVIHPQGFLGVPALMFIAICLAAAREWRGSLIAPMTMHAINNAIAMTVAIMMLG